MAQLSQYPNYDNVAPWRHLSSSNIKKSYNFMKIIAYSRNNTYLYKNNNLMYT